MSGRLISNKSHGHGRQRGLHLPASRVTYQDRSLYEVYWTLCQQANQIKGHLLVHLTPLRHMTASEVSDPVSDLRSSHTCPTSKISLAGITSAPSQLYRS